ncbi:hypothetical protein V5799_018101 [Amblyomma americanum]|uniref:Secreted protein n=1 Tax=Amblyomma americanum TaxID=6943 RepID=A0AAQ4F0R1_AMBAM
MTPNKMLSFALLAVTIVGMIGRSSAYGNDVIRPCPETEGPCYIHDDHSQEGCPYPCRCISDKINEGITTGWGRCFTDQYYG